MYDLNKIAAIACNIDPRNIQKKALYQLVKDIAKNDGKMSEWDLAHFYKAFSPALPAKPKSPEQWVWKAVAVKDVRDYLNYAYSDGARLIGTDGHRMHIYFTTKYSPGYYDKNMIKVHDTDWNRFPEVDRVIPDTKNSVYLGTPDDFEVREGEQDAAKPVPVKRCHGVEFLAKYFDEAICFMKKPLIHLRDKTSAGLIIDGDLLAVVMPRRY